MENKNETFNIAEVCRAGHVLGSCQSKRKVVHVSLDFPKKCASENGMQKNVQVEKHKTSDLCSRQCARITAGP